MGVTDSADTGPGQGQGTISAAIISSVNLDSGVKETFHEREDETEDEKEMREKHEVKYDDIFIAPLLYQDDLNVVSDSREGAQYVNDKMEHLMESKLLDLHPTKSVFIVTGRKKERKKMQKKLEKKPLLLYGKPIKQVSMEKY